MFVASDTRWQSENVTLVSIVNISIIIERARARHLTSEMRNIFIERSKKWFPKPCSLQLLPSSILRLGLSYRFVPSEGFIAIGQL